MLPSSLGVWLIVCGLQVRCWEVQENGQSEAKAEQSHAAPVLDCCWHVVSAE